MPDARVAGERIAALLEEVRSMSDARVQARAEELVRLLMELYGAGLERLLRVAEDASGGSGALAARLSDDELVSSLLALHGLHPVPIEDRVRRGIDKVRPYLGSHGGDVELIRIENGEAVLRLKGSCNGCPSSALTMRGAIEGAIEEAAPEIVAVRVEEATPAIAAGDALSTASATAIGAEPPLVTLGHGREAAVDDEAASARNWRPRWIAIDDAPALAPGEIAGLAVDASAIFLCRLEEGLYAYRDRCAACGSPFAGGKLELHTLTCPACGHGYDVRRAGQSRLAGSVLHLEPLPLLEDRGTVRISIPSPPDPRPPMDQSMAAS